MSSNVILRFSIKNIINITFLIIFLFCELLVFANTSMVDFTDLTFTISSKEFTSKGVKKKLDAAPFIENSTTLVPFRVILEELGYMIEWNDEEKSILATKDDSVIKLKINSIIANVNETEKELLVAPKIVSGRTVIPLRFISENSGANVVWDEATKSIYITKVAKLDTGKILFYEKTDKKKNIVVYDGNDVSIIPFGNKEVVNWYSFKGEVLLTIFDKDTNNNSFCILRDKKLETLIDNFDIKDAFEFNENLMIHGFDRIQKFDKLCRFDGKEFLVVKDNFYVGKRFIFRDKLIVNKYDNKRNYTLLAFDKNSWEPGILKEGFIIKDSIMDDNVSYMSGVWQTGSKKPLAVYNGDTIDSSSFSIIYPDIDVNLSKVCMFKGKFFIILQNNLVMLNQDSLNKVLFMEDGVYKKYSSNLIKIFNNKLYIGLTSKDSKLDNDYKPIKEDSKEDSLVGFVIVLTDNYVAKDPVHIDKPKDDFIVIEKGATKLIESLSPSEFRVDNNKLIILGKDTLNQDSVMYTYDFEGLLQKSVDVTAINNSVSIDKNTFIDVKDKNRITGTDRKTVILCNSELTNLVVGTETKKWASVGGSLIFYGFENDIKRNKLYSYGSIFNELMGNYDVDYWNQISEKLFMSGLDKDANTYRIFKFVDDKKVELKTGYQILKIIQAKGNYYFLDTIDKRKESPTFSKRILFIYDDENQKFIEMKVDLLISDMIFVK